MRVLKQDNNLLIQTRTYQFYYNSVEPLWATIIKNKTCRLRLYLLPQINLSDEKDKAEEVVSVSLEKDQESVVLHLTLRSMCWNTKEVFWKLSEQSIEHHCIVGGGKEFRIDDVIFLGASAYEKRLSQGNFNTVFSPLPNADFYNEFQPTETAENPVSAIKFRGGTGIFTPAPYFFALQWKSGTTIGMGIFCKPGDYNFSNFLYQGEPDGFCLRLAYDSATTAQSPWHTPSLVFYFGKDRMELLEHYCQEIYLKGFAQKNTRPKPLWWYGPIFCGWGEQCSEAMRVSHNKNNHQLNLSLARRACTQHNYQEWLKLLLQKGLKPRILIVDDGWAEKPGSFLPHPERWNDMREFIESCHQQGIKVLLWWNCFESEMIPFDETIRTIEGKSAVGLYGSPCADPTNPAFIQRFRKIMYKILSPDKGCLNADGLKVDKSNGFSVV